MLHQLKADPNKDKLIFMIHLPRRVTLLYSGSFFLKDIYRKETTDLDLIQLY